MLSNRNINGILAAIRLAKKSQSEMTNHHGAVIYSGWRPVSYGLNLKKTHRKSNSRYHFIHAELDAMLGVSDYHLNGAEMYLARLGFWGKNQIMFSKPCERCQILIRLAKINRVFYTIDNQTIGLWNVRRNIFQEIKTERLKYEWK